MQQPKPSRKKDPKALESIRELPCVVCGSTQVDAAHIRGKAAGGPDEMWNLIPLCRRDHKCQHDLGWYSFAWMHPSVMSYLAKLEWVWIDKKPWHENILG